jgi:hypothetical protein
MEMTAELRFKCSSSTALPHVFGDILLFILVVCWVFLKYYEHFSKPFKSSTIHFGYQSKTEHGAYCMLDLANQEKAWELVCLAANIYRARPFQRSSGAKSSRQGG